MTKITNDFGGRLDMENGTIQLVTYGTKHRGCLFTISERDAKLVRQHHWYISKNGYIWTKIEGKTIYLHRFIMNPATEEEIDHIDGNKLNNTRENLRIATHSQNMMNRAVEKSLYGRGVRLTKNGKFQARIGYNGKKKCLGTYNTAEEAASTYMKYAVALFGEFLPR